MNFNCSMPSISDVSFDQTFHEAISGDPTGSTITATDDVLEGDLTREESVIPDLNVVPMDSTFETTAPGITFPLYKMSDIHE